MTVAVVATAAGGGKRRLICGDCRDMVVVNRLFGDSVSGNQFPKAAVAITSPPYATQREYDSSILGAWRAARAAPYALGRPG